MIGSLLLLFGQFILPIYGGVSILASLVILLQIVYYEFSCRKATVTVISVKGQYKRVKGNLVKKYQAQFDITVRNESTKEEHLLTDKKIYVKQEGMQPKGYPKTGDSVLVYINKNNSKQIFMKKLLINKVLYHFFTGTVASALAIVVYSVGLGALLG